MDNGAFMSRTLTLALLLFEGLAAMTAQPPNAGIDKVVLEAQGIQDADNQRAFQEFDRLVFQPNGNASGARRRLESQLAMQIQDVDRACTLTDAQKKKLQL